MHLPARDPLGEVTAEEAGDQTPEEAGAHGGGDRSADDAGHEAGPVGDRVGDEAREDRHEEAEGGRTDEEEQRRPVHAVERVEGVLQDGHALGGGAGVEGVLRRDVDGSLLAPGELRHHEAEGDEDAARGDEGDHVGDTGHQHLADPGADRGLGVDLGGHTAATGSSPCTGGCRGGRLARVLGPLVDEVLDLGDELGPVGDALLHAHVDRRLAGEAADVLDGQVVREDHAIGLGDLCRGEWLGAGRALGLDEDLVACGLGCSLQALGGHVGVPMPVGHEVTRRA